MNHAARERARNQRRNRRRRAVRAYTNNRPTAAEKAEAARVSAGTWWRPQTRADCVSVPRPCPYVACRFNLYAEQTKVGTLKLLFPDIEPGELPADRSCLLDVVEAHPEGVPYPRIGELLNITREGARQILRRALGKLKKRGIIEP